MNKDEQRASYDALLELPIGTDFKKAAPGGFENAWSAIKNGRKKPFGHLNSPAFMRIKEARLTEKTLKRALRSNVITHEMAEHIRGMSIERVFAVNQMLCVALSRKIKGSGKNAFLPLDGFNKALQEFDLASF